MKKLVAMILVVTLLAATVLPVSAALDIPTVTLDYDGKAYYALGGKDDYFKAARYGIDNRMTAVPVLIDLEKFPDFESNNMWYCSVNNFDYVSEGLYFSYLEYSPSTVCMSSRYQNNIEDLIYGDIEISYIDSAEELKQADAMLDAELAKVASYSKADKIRHIARYICQKVDAGSREMPGGGYDTINGVYDLMTGVRTNVVCSSFAFLFQRFMERAGYRAYLATGGNHAWNVVELDGKWYGVDCTYGDDGTQMQDRYLLMGMDRLRGYITDTENVFAELEREQGCRFAATAYGVVPTTTAKPTTAAGAVATVAPTVKPAATTATAAKAPTTVRPAAPTAAAGATDTTTSGDASSTATDTTAADTTATTAPAVTVDVSLQPEVTAQVFASAVENNETVVLQAENYAWSFAADKLTNVGTAPLNTAIHLGEDVAPEDVAVLEEINQDEPFFPFSFAHHGALPGEAEIRIRVDASFAGKTVNIYSINDSGEAVLEGSGTVTADGDLVFTTNHCSLWFVRQAAKPPVNRLPVILCVAVLVAAALGVGLWLFLRKKRA